MILTITLLAIACIVVLGLLGALGLKWRLEDLADRPREHRSAPRRTQARTSLISGGEPGAARGGPDHPDWPRVPRHHRP